MRSFIPLATLSAIILAGCTSGDKSSTSSTATPAPPIWTNPSPTVTPCEPDDGDNEPCPGTPVPVIHQPLPPSGPIADADVLKHIPTGLSGRDRKIVETVMMAQLDYERPYVRWVFCKGQIFVFSLAGGYETPTASKVLNDDPHSKSNGGDYINFHNCIDFPMPGA